MGNFMASAMEENFKKTQKFQMETQRIMLERQIQMQNQMRERMMAAQLARTRELFMWLGSFYTIAGVGMIKAFMKTRKPSVIAPLLPLTFIVGYQADLAYGSKMSRINAEAENILMFERDIVDIPTGLPTVSTLDMARMQMHEDAKYKATTPDSTA